MSRGLQIFTAYSIRLTKKHTTILLIAFFILNLTVFLQMYAYKYHDNSQQRQSFGDLSYRPGAFLRGRQPGNISYCMFNYGLPNRLNWGSFQILSSPETGSKSKYGVIYNAIQGVAFANISKNDAVTYVTHATPEFLAHIVEIAKYWNGPISIAVFVPSYDLDIVMQILDHQCHCFPMMGKVSVHLFFPKHLMPKIRTLQEKILYLSTTPPPIATRISNIAVTDLLKQKKENYRELNNETRIEYIEMVRKNKIKRMMMKLPDDEYSAPNLNFDDCSGLDSDYIYTYRKSARMVYPINVGRNVARNASTTNYFLVSDIEMVPSFDLAPRFVRMIRKLMGNKKRDAGCVFAKTVFIVPLFEVERGEEIPHDKRTLVQMVESYRATYFHAKNCDYCHKFPGLQTWLMKPPGNTLEPMMIAKREYPYHRWEPLYFGTNKEPWYSEVLSWEGWMEKMIQLLEMCLQQYRMVILDGGFLCHGPRSTMYTYHRRRAKNINRRQYVRINKRLRQKYKDRPECRNG